MAVTLKVPWSTPLDPDEFPSPEKATELDAVVLVGLYGSATTGRPDFEVGDCLSYLDEELQVWENRPAVALAAAELDVSVAGLLSALRARGAVIEQRAEYRHPGHADQKVHGKWAQSSGTRVMNAEDFRAEAIAAGMGAAMARAVFPTGTRGLYRNGDSRRTADVSLMRRGNVVSDETMDMVFDRMTALYDRGDLPAGGRVRGNILSDSDFIDSMKQLDASLENAPRAYLEGVMGYTSGVVMTFRADKMSSSAHASAIADPGQFMPMGSKSTVRDYVVAHEFGHVVHNSTPDYVDTWNNAVDAPFFAAQSAYGKTSSQEGFAEAYAEWALSDGQTTNTAAVTLANAYGWS